MVDLTIKDENELFDFMRSIWRSKEEPNRKAYLLYWQVEGYDFETLKDVVFKLVKSTPFFPSISEIHKEMVWRSKHRELNKKVESLDIDAEGLKRLQQIVLDVFKPGLEF